MREKLAEYAHEAWSGWMRYLFEKSERNPDGNCHYSCPDGGKVD